MREKTEKSLKKRKKDKTWVLKMKGNCSTNERCVFLTGNDYFNCFFLLDLSKKRD